MSPVTVLEYLRAKAVPLTVSRLASDLRRDPLVIEADLKNLKSQGLVARVGAAWYSPAPTRATEPPADSPPARPELLCRAPRVAVDKPALQPKPTSAPIRQPSTMLNEEAVMPRGLKTCTKCHEAKGIRAFEKNSEICKSCAGAAPVKRKPPAAKRGRKVQARRAPAGMNGGARRVPDAVTPRGSLEQLGGHWAPPIEEVAANLRKLGERYLKAAAALEGVA